MIRSCVTVSLVPQARGGPFVYWDDLPAACRSAAALGFDAIEVFAPSARAVNVEDLRRLLADHNLKLAAVGTGAGWVIERLTLTSGDADVRRRARDFVRSIIDLGAPFGAPAIIGSMQGRWGDGIDRETAVEYLREALNELGEFAARAGTRLIYEPLNRYETNMANTLAAGAGILDRLSTDNVVLLADLFHMNIEETDLAEAIRSSGPRIGHVHFVDSNRQAAGRGHLDFQPIAAALRETEYDGYASAEALPIPDSEEAARQTMAAYRSAFEMP